MNDGSRLLGDRVQRLRELDQPHDDVPIPARLRQQPLVEQLVDLLDEVEFLVQ